MPTVPEHEREHPSLEVLALAYVDDVHLGRAVGPLGERVGVTRVASPGVGVGHRQHDPVGIGPVVVQALPDAAGALGDVGLVLALAVHLEVAVCALAEELLATRTEVGQRGDELLGRRGGCVAVANG